MYQNFQCKAKKVKVFHKQNKIHNARLYNSQLLQITKKKKDTLRKRSYNKLDAENEFCQGFIHGSFSQ
jgi:hypothetical protein